MSMPPPGGWAQPAGGAVPQPVPDYMVQAIVATIVAFFCCCVVGAIPGVVSIVMNNQAKTSAAMGDYQTAMAKASQAKTWLYVTVGLIALGLVLNLISAVTGNLVYTPT